MPHAARQLPSWLTYNVRQAMLNKPDIETFRTPHVFLRWFHELLDRINCDRTNRADALLHVGAFKQFYEEVLPLASLLRVKKAQWESYEFRNVLGSQSYDVETRGLELQYLEIVSTVFDDGERFRIQRLMAEGSVDGIAKVTRGHRGRPIALENEGDMRLHDTLISERIALIESVVRKKASRQYPPKTGLVVYYDDSSIEIDQEDEKRVLR